MQGTILFILLLHALVHCKHLCFTRTGRESRQALRTRFSPSCSLLGNLWSLQSPGKDVFYVPWWELSLSWRSVVLQEHMPREDPSQCRSVATDSRTTYCFIPNQSKAPFITLHLHTKLPLRSHKNAPVLSCVRLQISCCSSEALVTGE